MNNGWPYDKAWREGVGRSQEEFKLRWQRLQAYLDEIDYPLPILLLQSYHPYGDNGSAFDFTPFIDEWNANNETQNRLCDPASMVSRCTGICSLALDVSRRLDGLLEFWFDQ